MIYEYKYYPEPKIALVLQAKLKLKTSIKYILMLIDFTASEDVEQGSFLNIDKEDILCIVDTDNIQLRHTKEQRIIIGDYIDYDVIDQACWTEWKLWN